MRGVDLFMFSLVRSHFFHSPSNNDKISIKINNNRIRIPTIRGFKLAHWNWYVLFYIRFDIETFFVFSSFTPFAVPSLGTREYVSCVSFFFIFTSPRWVIEFQFHFAFLSVYFFPLNFERFMRRTIHCLNSQKANRTHTHRMRIRVQKSH